MRSPKLREWQDWVDNMYVVCRNGVNIADFDCRGMARNYAQCIGDGAYVVLRYKAGRVPGVAQGWGQKVVWKPEASHD